LPRKAVSMLMVTLLLIGFLGLVFSVRPAEASGTVYIRADGTVDPPIASVWIERDWDLYTFTCNIYDSIIVERDNIVLDGGGYILEGDGSGKGIDLTERSNVTVRNVKIKRFFHGVFLCRSSFNNIYGNDIEENNLQSPRYDGIYLNDSFNNTISGNNIRNNGDGIEFVAYCSGNRVLGNNITNNYEGIDLWHSSLNVVSGNNITDNNWDGIEVLYSSWNIISENTVTENYYDGIKIQNSSSNSIWRNLIRSNGNGIEFKAYSANNSALKNNLTDNMFGIYLQDSSSNSFCHNCFFDNDVQVYCYDSSNVWDNGSEGNYWSDYNGTDGDNDGIGDAPYVVGESDFDRYPLMNPWVPKKTLITDINGDGTVNILDIGIVALVFGSRLGDENWNERTDLDRNGVINILDLSMVARDYGKKA